MFRPGDRATIGFQNPWPTGSALLVWGNSVEDLKSQVVSQVQGGGFTNLAVDLGPECRRGCAAAVVLSVPRAGTGEGRGGRQGAGTWVATNGVKLRIRIKVFCWCKGCLLWPWQI